VVLGLPDMSEIQPSTPPDDDSVMIITATPTHKNEDTNKLNEFKGTIPNKSHSTW
jgi:hypothetical protein